MKIQIVGGNFSDTQSKPSGVIRKLIEAFTLNAGPGTVELTDCINGGKIEELPMVLQGDVNIWMPNISNEEEKHYPMKHVGAILICSKVMRDRYTMVDAVSRIFKMHGNAVIAITYDKAEGIYVMELIDALGNTWYKGSDLRGLATGIMSFVAFTKSARRIQTTAITNENFKDAYSQHFEDRKQDLKKFIELNKCLQDSIMQKCGSRFFGNLSTRCSKLFPSLYVNDNDIFVSPRNVDKGSITPEDMILYIKGDKYYTKNYTKPTKPSVDSPAQIRLYEAFPNIKYMIHGHAFILGDDFKTTENYCLCGDINEVNEIIKAVDDPYAHLLKINLKNHGFLIGADKLETLEYLIKDITDKHYVKMR